MKKKVKKKDVEATLNFLDSFNDEPKKRIKRPRIISKQLVFKMCPKG